MYNDEPELIYVTETGNEYSTREEAEEDVLEICCQKSSLKHLHLWWVGTSF